ncbi:hypothetical protein KAX35_07525, partial [candidate division WOR-3 bacterium]|nr:hypothetical protein [candidate division WOR-3 bacterium]
MDGSLHDASYLRTDALTDSFKQLYCGRYIGSWYDEYVCNEPFELQNIYAHFWISMNDSSGDYPPYGYKDYSDRTIKEFGWNNMRRSLATTFEETIAVNITTHNRSFLVFNDSEINPDEWRHTSDNYTLVTFRLNCTVGERNFTDNSIYNLEIGIDTEPGSQEWWFPSIISNASFPSFYTFNIPSNETLNAENAGAGRDSDSDGLNDTTELWVTYSSPFDSDTDNDGANDYDEYMTYGTDPNNWQDYFSLSNEYPTNGSSDVELTPQNSITISTDIDTNIYWNWNNSGTWEKFGENLSSSSGAYYQLFSNASSECTEYTWSINASRGGLWTNRSYSFTTEDTIDPTVAIKFAGNTGDSGGPYWRPPDETDILDEAGEGIWRDGYYTNNSRQTEGWI